HAYTIRTPQREALAEGLAAAGIQTGVHYPIPVHLQPAYRDARYPERSLPAAERAAREVLSLPIHPELEPTQIEAVCQAVIRIQSKAKPDGKTAMALMAVTMAACAGWCSPVLRAQTALGTPSIKAAVKGPDQINLIWPAVANAGYGYVVEIQSVDDSRYSAWTELQPIPVATGYT